MKNILLILAISMMAFSCKKEDDLGFKYNKKYHCTNCATEEWIEFRRPDKIIVQDATGKNTYTFVTAGASVIFNNNMALIYLGVDDYFSGLGNEYR